MPQSMYIRTLLIACQTAIWNMPKERETRLLTFPTSSFRSNSRPALPQHKNKFPSIRFCLLLSKELLFSSYCFSSYPLSGFRGLQKKIVDFEKVFHFRVQNKECKQSFRKSEQTNCLHCLRFPRNEATAEIANGSK